MTLGITKSYTPASAEVGISASYNTDVGALFNAFAGLEAQTSTLGGLTITPSADGTTKFKITNAAGTELLSADTTGSSLKLKATAKLYLDGGGDTYLQESAADILDIYVGALNMLKFTEAATDKLEVLGSDLEIDATKKFYLDGGGDTYLTEEVADAIYFYAGGVHVLSLLEAATDCVSTNVDVYLNTAKKLYFSTLGGDDYIDSNSGTEIMFCTDGAERFSVDDNTGGTGGSGSAGSGKQYVELNIAGNRYKILHDGTV